jgi:hypothetical protein
MKDVDAVARIIISLTCAVLSKRVRRKLKLQNPLGG